MCEETFTDEMAKQTGSISLIKESNHITEDLIKEDDPEKFRNLVDLFKLNMQKKTFARMNKLSNLLELVDDEVLNRLSCTPESFDEQTLLKYMDSVQRTINEMNNGPVPQIQINNQDNSININSNSGISRESRQKIIDDVMKLLEQQKAEEQEEEE